MTTITGSRFGARAARLAWSALCAVVLIPNVTAAQQMRALPPAGEVWQPPTGRFGPGNPGSTLLPPSAPTAPPAAAPIPAQAVPQVPAGQVALMASARFGRDVPQPITGGLLWRVYPTKPDAAGVFRALK